jgi:hypothetical protein
VVPTAERAFAATTQVTALWRLYQSGRQPIAPASITITIRDATDQIRAQDTRTIAVDGFPSAGADLLAKQEAPTVLPRGSAGRPATPATTAPGETFANLALRSSDVRYALPLSTLPAGEYLLTFEAEIGTTTVRRDVRFSVRR